MQNQKIKNLTLMAMFIALSAVGANIRVPSPTGTVAFDSAPGFLAALLLGPAHGAAAAALGHLFTSLFAGFPLTIPLHLVIAVEMAIFAAVFSALKRFNLPLAVITTSLLNGIIAPASFIPLPQFGLAFFTAMLIPLIVASALNVACAAAIYKIITTAQKSIESQ